ncbi:dehydratase [Leucobacter denitrificans]|uniref:Dehydratase n=1 Tax=Leucobacter denitrificans TaxID=683042 RepID=A0A7G9S294_9MICO|nr:dehydratase [Leucobacter denitrificans]QNN61969.1 dehydratase [Leucobacter denitrificans]
MTNAPGLWFEEFTLGQEWITPRRTITDADVVGFVGLTGSAVDVDPSGRLIMPEAGAVAIATGLAWVRLGINEGTAMAVLGMKDWSFIEPVCSGDTVYVMQRIAALRPSRSKPDRGIVEFEFEIRTHEHKVCQRGTWVFLWSKKPE